MSGLLTFERQLWYAGHQYVAGVDEAGRGPLAGPVVAAAVVFPKNTTNTLDIRDSKQLSTQKRQQLKMVVEQHAVSIGIGIVNPDLIDQINILQASLRAMDQAVRQLTVTPDHLLIDGIHAPETDVPLTCIKKGDSRSMAIAAASIIAKVTRDDIMIKFDRQYPDYGFARHKGYPTRGHIKSIQQLGFSPIHRRSFHVRQMVE